MCKMLHTFCFRVLQRVHATATRALLAGRGRSASSTCGDRRASSFSEGKLDGDFAGMLEGCMLNEFGLIGPAEDKLVEDGLLCFRGMSV